MRSPENEHLIHAMWDDYEREGLPGILRWATENARWHPYSAGGTVFRDTAEYRAEVERATAAGIRVDSVKLGVWSHGDAGVVRGRLRTRQGGVRDDTRMYWLHRVRAHKVVWTSSSPDLAGLLQEAGLDRTLATEAFLALHGE